MMKRTIIVLLIASAFSWSCSSDKDKNPAEPDSIAGTWEARELKIDDASASVDEKNGRDLLNFLTARECYILKLTFNEDLSLITENALNYLEINVNGSGTGLDIPCPTEKDIDTSTYTYDGQVITFVDADSQTVTLNVSISGDTMAVDAADLDIADLNTGGQLIFQRR